jgi:predicted RNase H-like HicB family nuclease
MMMEMLFAVILHRDSGSGCGAEVPALPGRYSQGDSIPKLLDYVRAAGGGVVEVLKREEMQPNSNGHFEDIASIGRCTHPYSQSIPPLLPLSRRWIHADQS